MAAVYDEDPLNFLIDLEDGCSDPGMKENVQTFGLLMSILRPFLGFLFQQGITVQNQDQEEFHVCSRHILAVAQKIDSPGTNAEPVQVASHLESLKSLKEDIVRVVSLRPSFPDHIYVRRFEVVNLMQFIENLSQNMKYIDVICKAHIIFRVKNELLGLEQRLKILATFLSITEPIILFYNVKSVVRSAQVLAAEISCYLFLSLVDDEDNELVAAGDHMKEDSLPDLLMKISILLRELRDLHKEQGPNSIRLPDAHSPAMNEHPLGFLDYLMHKLRKLLHNTASCMVAVKIQIDTLVDELSFIRSILMDMPDMLLQNSSQAMKSLRFSIEALIMEAGLFIYFSLDKETNEELIMVNYLSFGLPDLVEAAHTIHQQARDIFHENFLQPWPSKFLSMEELEFVDFLVKKLEGVLDSKAASNDALKSHIRMVHENLVTLRKCFLEMAELIVNSQMEFLLTRLMHVAYQAEYLVDSLRAGERSIWIHKLGTCVITQDIKILKKEVKTILNMNSESYVHSISKASISGSTQIFEPSSNNAPSCSNDEMEIKIEEDFNKLVGVKDAVAEIIGLLTDGSRHLKILSIVGMPGLGKTTLANAVYEHLCLHNIFYIHAWCCVSQVYHREALLSSILGQICPEKTKQNHEISGEDFLQMVYTSLKGKKYLIVMDDIWDIDAWNDLRECFPDDGNGSRILFTTRNHAVAVQAKSIPYPLRLLSNEESCELLWLKLFRGETCPQELSSISKHIASSCKGLPLAIVLVAGILKREKRNKSSWEQVAKTLIRSCSIKEKMLEVAEASYKHLPDYLKPIFLHFGTFPVGTAIVVSKMIRLWISEGFVQQPNQKHKSLKEEARSYLNDLNDRSLVMITRKSSIGGVKACRVHDVLQEFCSAKLEEERYVTLEDIYGGISVLYGDYKMHKLNLLRMFSPAKVPEIYSLLYYNKSDIDTESRIEDSSDQVQFTALAPPNRAPLSDQVFRHLLSVGRYNRSEQVGMFRSRLGVPGTRTPRFGVLGTITRQCRHLDFGYIVKYKNLRVLDLGSVQVQNSADTLDLVKISKLVHLIYLAVRVRTMEIPSEVCNLRNLETFHLSGAIGKVTLPEAIWKLTKLREVIMDHCFFSVQHYSQEFFENSSKLYNLTSISTLFIQHGDVEKFMRRLPRVQKLGCRFSSTLQAYSEASNIFDILEFLCELESLKMSFCSRSPCPFQFRFPLNLKKLTMCNSLLPWDEISVIGQLPNLEVLKLLNRAFKGQQWDTKEGEFQQLKFLKLESLDIELWNASSEHLPCLEQLVVLSCEQLQEIPSSFGEIPTLQLIEMKWCSISATDSAKQILEVQRNYGNDELNVIAVGRQRDLP